MPHGQYREGTVQNLKRDYIIMVAPHRQKNVAPRFRQVIRILWKYKPVNLGKFFVGSIKNPTFTIRNIYNDVDHMHEERSIVMRTYADDFINAVYTDYETVKNVVRELKEIGFSCTVSALWDDVWKLTKELGLGHPHSCNVALDIWRKGKDPLPPQEILEITTMCGHLFVTPNLVEDTIELVKKGKLTIEQAADKIASPCVCGIFNTERAKELIKKLL